MYYTLSLGLMGLETLKALLPLNCPMWPMYFRLSPTLSVSGADDGFSVRMMSPICRFMSSPSLMFVSARIAVTVSFAESR